MTTLACAQPLLSLSLVKCGVAGEESRASAAYNEYYSSTVQPFVDVCRKVKETSYIVRDISLQALADCFSMQGDAVETAFKRQGELIAAAGASKKPSQDALMAFIKPIADQFGVAESKVQRVRSRAITSSPVCCFVSGRQPLAFLQPAEVVR